jgi:hypothetical protein
MIHAIVGSIALGCVLGGFIIGFGLIFEDLIKKIKNDRKNR